MKECSRRRVQEEEEREKDNKIHFFLSLVFAPFEFGHPLEGVTKEEEGVQLQVTCITRSTPE